jgi:predicted GIY-YIG superfamily endonuclease
LGYSEKRAKKDAFNREKGLKRLEKEYKSGTITKLITPKHKSIAQILKPNFWENS